MTITGSSRQTSLDEGSSLTVPPQGSPQGDQATVLRSPQAINDYVPPPSATHAPHMVPVISPSPHTQNPHQNLDTPLISTSIEASHQSLGAVVSQETGMIYYPPPNYEGQSQEDEYNRQLQLEEQQQLEQQQNLYLQYEQQRQQQQQQQQLQQQQQQQYQPLAYPVPDSNSSTSNIVQVTPSTGVTSYKDVTFIPCEPMMNNDYTKGRYTFSIFLFNVQNYRKKEFYIMFVLVLAIILGILGGTVWNKSSSGGSGNKNINGSGSGSGSGTTGVPSAGNPSSGGSRTSWSGGATPTATFTGSLTSATSAPSTSTSTSPAPTSAAPAPSPSPAPPKGSGDMQCNVACGNKSSTCDANCKNNDSALNSCLSTCSGDQRAVTNCVADCRYNNPCLNTCFNSWSNCVQGCPP